MKRDTAQDGETLRITPGGFEAVVVAIAWPRRRHDDDAVDASLVHQRHQLLDGDRLGKLRLAPRPPFPIVGFRLPQMHLGIDNHSSGYGHECFLSTRLILSGKFALFCDRSQCGRVGPSLPGLTPGVSDLPWAIANDYGIS